MPCMAGLDFTCALHVWLFVLLQHACTMRGIRTYLVFVPAERPLPVSLPLLSRHIPVNTAALPTAGYSPVYAL